MVNQKRKLAVFPGSFDPFTEAHMCILNHAMQHYDKIIVLVASNPNKKYMFTSDQRVTMISKIFAGDPNFCTQCFVEKWDGLLVDFLLKYTKEYDVINIIRGLRNDNGAEEVTLANIYYEDSEHLGHPFETVFFTIYNKKYQHVSSTRVRSYIHARDMDSIRYYCPIQVYENIVKILKCIDEYRH